MGFFRSPQGSVNIKAGMEATSVTHGHSFTFLILVLHSSIGTSRASTSS